MLFNLARRTLPWCIFVSLLAYQYRVPDLLTSVPAYGDVLEVLWGVQWFDAHLWPFDGSVLFAPHLFYPEGWQVATYAHSPAFLIGLIPVSRLGGVALAYNIATLLAFLISFSGMYLLARRLTGAYLVATIAAVLFTFWGFRWLRVWGHLNVLLASALLPWLVLALEHACHPSHRAKLWFLVAGAVWGISVAITFYFLWIGGIIILLYLAVRVIVSSMKFRSALVGLMISAIVALALSAPVLLTFFRASTIASAHSYNIAAVNPWGASLNSFPIPTLIKPWTRAVAHSLYQGPSDESGVANFGLLGFVLSAIGIWAAHRNRIWWPYIMLFIVGLLLSMGFTLRWNGQVVQWPAMRHVNAVIWQIGYALKPSFFGMAKPFFPFEQAIPLPGLVLAAIVPFWEAARTLSRYAFVAALGYFLLVAQGVKYLRLPVVQVALVILLALELVPGPTGGVPFPPPSHPAFDWLQAHAASHDVVVDVFALTSDKLQLFVGGEPLWATKLHGLPTASGAGSVWPSHTWFLFEWLVQHPHPLQQPDLIPVLRYYGITYILMYMKDARERAILEDARNNPGLELQDCFAPPSIHSPWPYPICILHIKPPSQYNVNLTLRDGWSGPEAWGVWAEGLASQAHWIATSQADSRMLIEAFPQCVPGEFQQMTILLNGEPLAKHQWTNCEPWSDTIVISGIRLNIGWNELQFVFAYANRPIDLTEGVNPDFRSLSVGFTRLQVIQP